MYAVSAVPAVLAVLARQQHFDRVQALCLASRGSAAPAVSAVPAPLAELARQQRLDRVQALCLASNGTG